MYRLSQEKYQQQNFKKEVRGIYKEQCRKNEDSLWVDI